MVVRVRPIGPPTFDELLDAGGELLKELRALESQRRLSAKAFVVEACANAQIDAARLAEVHAQIKRSGDESRAFLNRVAREFSSALTYPRPPSNVDRLEYEGRPQERVTNAVDRTLRIYGGPATRHELTDLKISAAEAIAAAAHEAAQRWPESFGTIENYGQHVATCERLRHELFDLAHQLRTAWQPGDVEFERGTETDRQQGRTYVTFKHAALAGLGPSMPDWPEAALARVADRIAASDTRKASIEQVKAKDVELVQAPQQHATAVRVENAASRF